MLETKRRMFACLAFFHALPVSFTFPLLLQFQTAILNSSLVRLPVQDNEHPLKR
jgi:hypothetical protein